MFGLKTFCPSLVRSAKTLGEFKDYTLSVRVD